MIQGMAPARAPSPADLRRCLTEVFVRDQDLLDFCSDHFPEAYRRFGRDMERGQKILILLDMVCRDGAEERLVDLLRQDFPKSPAIAKLSTAPAATGQAWNIPPASAYFTGREQQLKDLRAGLCGAGLAAISQVHAVSGLGGIGKTQLALAYAKVHRADYQAGFFVGAENEVSLQKGLGEMARHLGFPSELKPEERLAAIRDWLEHHEGLVILDNADTLALVKPLCRSGLRAHVLITTRAWNCGAIGVAQPLRLQKMAPAESAAFVQKRIGRERLDADEAAALVQIAEQMDHLPLALEQAGAYIAERQMRLASYLLLYWQKRVDLLKERPEHGDYPAAVATTWSMNIAEVRKQAPQAVALMELGAFLAPEGIPEELLLDGVDELGSELAEGLAEAGALDNWLGALLRYSLIRRDAEARTFDLHRLVQVVIQAGLREEERQTWAQRSVEVLHRVHPDPDYGNWTLCQRLSAHARTALALINAGTVAGPAAGYLLGKAGRYLYQQGQYRDAEPFWVAALKVREKALGPEHPDVAASCNNLAGLYQDQGKYAEAERLYLRALAMWEKALGVSHPHFITVCNNLAKLYEAQGRKEDAARARAGQYL
jgi:tetratricopeptide (TPR) repeat protein